MRIKSEWYWVVRGNEYLVRGNPAVWTTEPSEAKDFPKNVARVIAEGLDADWEKQPDLIEDGNGLTVDWDAEEEE